MICRFLKNTLILFLSAFLLLACSKDYEVKTTGHVIEIHMPGPTVGITGVNETSYDVYPSIIAEALWDEFHGLKGMGKEGDYTVCIYRLYTDKYGEKKSKYAGELCVIKSTEMNRYQSKDYFIQPFARDISRFFERNSNGNTDESFSENSIGAAEKFDRAMRLQKEKTNGKLNIKWGSIVIVVVVTLFIAFLFWLFRLIFKNDKRGGVVVLLHLFGGLLFTLLFTALIVFVLKKYIF